MRKYNMDNEKQDKAVSDEEIKHTQETEISEEENGDKPESDKISKPIKFWRYIYTEVIPVMIFFIVIGLLINAFFYQEKLIERNSLKSSITKLIENDADLRAVKFLYKNRPLVKSNLFFWIKHKKIDYISFNTPLSELLEDIRTEIYLSGNKDNNKLLKLESVIDTYNSTNPFDKLESGQKDLFENIRIKLSNNYSSVSSEINKLSDELHNKNLLVNEYLSDSKTSLFVSIISAFIAVILAGIQMYQNQNKSTKRIKSIKSKSGEGSIVRTSNGNRYRRARDEDGKLRMIRIHDDED